MDGPYAAVKFPPKDSSLQGAIHTKEAVSNEEATSLLQDVRLLRKDELQVSLLCRVYDWSHVESVYDLEALNTKGVGDDFLCWLWFLVINFVFLCSWLSHLLPTRFLTVFNVHQSFCLFHKGPGL